MSDFLKYWDTRIDANERFFNNYPQIANFAFSECQALWEHMEEERKALLTRHNALVEAVANTLIIYDRMAPSLKDHIAARAEVDRLMEEK